MRTNYVLFPIQINEDEAAVAYDIAALEKWGDRAQLNFPKGGKRE